MAKTSGKHIAEVADSGPGLIFVAYPAAMSELPFSTLFNIIFFIMILFIGLDTQVEI
jgi:SNF family Na+-dependent transporter